jgi:putative transposase
VPRKNSRKIYFENGFYHVYNRGVEKREIFMEPADYAFFLHLIKGALSPPEKQKLFDEGIFRPRRKNFYGKIDLLCYVLMPNHFHFILRQNDKSTITEFIRSILTSYSMYFNKKYGRVGALFQGVFKAIDIHEENHLLWLSRYIHLNPINFTNYPYSSYDDYLQKKNTSWINKSLILDYFSSNPLKKSKNYQEFVENKKNNEGMDLENLTLESDDLD